jgi:hypothetical protein
LEKLLLHLNANSRKQRPNAECDKLIRILEAALWQFQYRGTREDFINYKKTEAKTRNDLKVEEGIIHKLRRVADQIHKPLVHLEQNQALKNQWNYCDNASEYKEENINEARKMIDELYPPWAPSIPPSP